jgi:glycosyltransferase involved in cell wall biosynthesis
VKRKLSVVTLIDSIRSAGGAERLAANLMIGLDPSRFDRTLCFTRPAKPQDREAVALVSEQARAAGVRLLTLQRRSVFDLRAWAPLWSLLRSQRVDILHAHMFGSNVWGAIVGRLAGVPVVIAHEHGWSFSGSPLRRVLDRELVGRATDIYLAVSRDYREKMISVVGVRPSDVLFLPNGIRAPQPGAEGHDVRAELGIPPAAPVIGAVGVLRPEKAIEVLLEAVALLAPELPDLRALVVGNGPERERLESLAAELGIGDRVTFTGVRTDIPDILRALDVAVCCSDYEGSPISVLEYMEAAKPIVATRVGGVPDLIDDGVHGVLVEPRDPPALAAAVAGMLRDPAMAADLGARARERRRAQFELDVMIGRLEALYEDLYAAKQSRGGRYRPLRRPVEHVRPVSGG